MHIGIFTWHFFTNVGSFLQALALQNVIHSLGHSVKIIDYRKNYLPKGVKGYIWKTFTKFYFLLPHFLLPRQMMKYYVIQRKYMNLSPNVSKENLQKLNNLFDAFVCGSDQIWAPNVFDESYLLSFVAPDKKRIAYAPSIGLQVIPESLKTLYKSNISKFSAVSVREKQGADLLKKEFGIFAQTVLDPTLLLDSVEWTELLKISKVREKPYIFCYFLGKNTWQVQFAKKIADRDGKKLFIMSPHKEFAKYADKYWKNLMPDRFLELVSSAEQIFTDSFHGMAFSINFQKDFYFFHRFADNDPINQNSRVDNLANLLGLESRLVTQDSLFIDNKILNYVEVAKRLQNERQKSLQYLKKALCS